MFKSLTQNKPEVPGKRANAQTLHGKATHFILGDDSLKGIQSTSHATYAFSQAQRIQKTDTQKPHGSKVDFGQEKLTYKTEAKAT